MSRTSFVLLFLAAWLIRGLWVGFFEPPSKHLFSDMATYVELARRLPAPTPDESLVFFPFGTPLFIAFCFHCARVIGCPEMLLLSLILSCAIALQVPLIASIAVSFGVSGRSAMLLGSCLCVWPPSILQSSYILSEHLFCTGMLTTIWLWGRARRLSPSWYVAVGVCAAVTCFVRPQFMLGIALAYVALRLHGSSMRGLWLVAGVLGMTLTLGIARAHWHCGVPHFISSNAGVNLVFGACHNRRIVIRDEHQRVVADFEPPVFVQLYESPPRLEALGTRSTSRDYTIWVDGGLRVSPSLRIAWRCLQEASLPELVRGRLVHVAWLFVGNRMWPSSTKTKNWMWLDASDALLLILGLPALIIAALTRAIRRSEWGSILLSQIAAMVLTSVVFFGSARLRSPYDPILMILVVVVVEHWMRIFAPARADAQDLSS